MKIMAPASNWEDTERIIQSGAHDIYVGGDWNGFHNYSFSGRGKYAQSGKRVLATAEEINKMAKAIHEMDGNLYFLANCPFIVDSIHKKNQSMVDMFLKYIENGIVNGADYIIAGDLGSIELIKKYFPEIPISASSYLEVQNEWSLKLLENLGVSQAILSYQCTLKEIEHLCNASLLKIEVFGHGGCSFFVGTCNMFHEMGEKGVSMGYPCKAWYHTECEQLSKDFRVLDGFKMCSLCMLKKLNDFNVYSIKIVGRDLQGEYIAQIVKMYLTALQAIKDNVPLENLLEQLPQWWKKGWCSDGSLCKYKE